MNDNLIIYGGGALFLSLLIWKAKTGLQKMVTGPGGKPMTLEDKIAYTRSAMNTAYSQNDVDSYLKFQRDLQLLELEVA